MAEIVRGDGEAPQTSRYFAAGTAPAGNPLSLSGISIHNHRYRPEIDGLRALAVIAVIINHISKGLLPAGYLGVDIFFVISGYVITSSLVGRETEGLGEFLSGFYIRRIKRLVPVLVLFVVVTGALICLFDPEPALSLRTGAAALFGLSNLYLFKQASDYFGSMAELNVYTHTWSLGVEEQFYLLFPILFWATQRGGGRRFVILSAGLSAASLGAFVVLYGIDQPAAFFLMPTRLWELGVGCLLVGVLRGGSRSSSATVPFLATAGIGVVLFAPPALHVPATIAVVVLTAMLIVLLRPETVAYRLFAHPRVVYIGTISYSLYLWHWSVLSLSRWTIGVHWWSIPIQVGIMFLLAAASYRYVESPLRRAKWSVRPRRTITYGVAVSTAGAACLLFLGFVGPGWLYSGTPWTEPQEEPAAVSSHPPGRNGAVVLIGDSHARHFSGLARTVASALAMESRLVTRGMTPFPTVNISTPVGGQTLRRRQVNNARMTENVREVMTAGRGGKRLVLLSSFYQYYFDTPAGSRRYQRLIHYRETGEEIGAQESLDRWLDELERFATEHSDAQIVVFLSTPEMPGIYSELLCRREWFRPFPSENCVVNLPRAEVVGRLSAVNKRIIDRAATLKNVLVFDPTAALCPATRTFCNSHERGNRLYFDEDHLTAFGSQKVEAAFMRFMTEHNIRMRLSGEAT
jgi:peptidoglycan/LPS O-acetylase OafA/YrhL